jgi:hypothetical protein
MKAKNDLTRDEVADLIDYDPQTGIFRWRKHRGSSATIKAGREAGRIAAHGYRQIFLKERRYYASRLAWLLVTGEWPQDQMDHANGVKDDDRFENLRPCTQSENMANCRRSKGNTTGFKGVSFVPTHNGPNKYKAGIKKNNKPYFLGWFPTAEVAAAARVGAAAILHGEFARNE